MDKSIEHDVVRVVDVEEYLMNKKIRVVMFRTALANGQVGLAALLPVAKDLKIVLDHAKGITAVKN